MSETPPEAITKEQLPDRGYEPGIFNYLKWLYLSFEGRIRLREMWFGNIGLYLVIVILGIAARISSGVTLPDVDEAREQDLSYFDWFFATDAPTWLPWVGIFLFVFLLFGMVVLQVKRLHDRGKSAWWLVFFFFAPGVLISLQASIYAATGVSPEVETAGENPVTFTNIASVILGMAASLISLWWFIELWFVPGKKGPNLYGPDARQIPPTYRYHGAPGTSPHDTKP